MDCKFLTDGSRNSRVKMEKLPGFPLMKNAERVGLNVDIKEISLTIMKQLVQKFDC